MLRKTLPRFLAFVIASFLLQAYAVGAVSGIGLSLLGYSLGNSDVHRAPPGYDLIIEAQLVNYDSTQYIGPISFGLKHDNGVVLTDAEGIFEQPHYSGGVIVMAAYETVPAIFNIHIDAAYFVPGPDVVVVWPIAQLPAVDSISIQLLIGADTVSSGISNTTEPVLRYSVGENKIFLFGTGPRMNFKQVRIYDIMGQKVGELNADHIAEIPLPELPAGIYLCEMVNTEGRSSIIRFFHQ